MGWKEFLKPDKRKVAVFFIICCVYLVLASLFAIILNAQTPSPPYEAISPLEAYPYVIFVIFIIRLFLLPGSSILGIIQFWIMVHYSRSMSIEEFGKFIHSDIFVYTSTLLSILGWILNLIYWYCLSCLIIWAYDKLKKKPEEKKKK
jgi:hypothetical protein